jgi:hypothetical protein
MTAAPTVRSAYPPPIEALMPKARALAVDLGDLPSRNRLMREFRIGAPKADALRAALTDDLASQDGHPVSAPPAPQAPTPEPPADPHPDDGAPPAEPDEATPDRSDADASAEPGAEVIASPRQARRPVAWPVLFLALPAFVAIWSGWVELGRLTGFGVVRPLPGIADSVTLDTAITLPIGVETYAAYALWVWLSARAPQRARRFAKWSAIGSLVFGAAGQVAYHLMAAAGIEAAPWPITTAVSCLPVAVLGMGAALAHLLHSDNDREVAP